MDEYLLFTGADPVRSLPAFLLDYEKYSALAIHWILFGSSEHNARPLKGVLRSYYKSMPLNHTQHLFVKTIVNTKCTVGPSDSPHSFRHNCSAPAVRADFSPIEGATASDLPVHERVLIHHYATKSAEDFELKTLKGSGMRRQRYFIIPVIMPINYLCWSDLNEYILFELQGLGVLLLCRWMVDRFQF